MKADQYVTVAREGVHESEINRSRFLCSLAPAATEPEAQEFIARIRKEHPTASHNCFAYVIGADASVQKASDDGEPGGTAGVPMLQMLMRRDVRYAVAVVTRYYGGVKLGAGGLIRAYGGVVGEALDELGTVTRRRYRLATVTVDHQRAARPRTTCAPPAGPWWTCATGPPSRSRSPCPRRTCPPSRPGSPTVRPEAPPSPSAGRRTRPEDVARGPR